MPFIASLGRRQCNVCRKVTPKGGTVYQGDVTGMEWCVACAETTLHKTPEPLQVSCLGRKLKLPSSWTRIGPQAVPSWFERGED